MILRFQADADLNQIILHAVVRRAPALDFQIAAAAGLAGLRDPEVLALAARDGRVLVTHDQKTMPRHFAAFIATATSPGVLIIPQRLPIATAVEDLLLIWCAPRKLIDGMRGNLLGLYREPSEPLGLSRARRFVPVSSMPPKGTGEARGKPPRSLAWLRDHMVSSNEVDFNLRGSTTLSQDLAQWDSQQVEEA
jgi:hypothetical protein